MILDLTLDTLATARLTRLVTTDVITESLRGRLIEWAYRDQVVEWDVAANGWTQLAESDEDPPKLATLLICQWCSGVWVAGAVSVVRSTRLWKWARVPLAMSMVTGLIAENLE